MGRFRFRDARGRFVRFRDARGRFVSHYLVDYTWRRPGVRYWYRITDGAPVTLEKKP